MLLSASVALIGAAGQGRCALREGLWTLAELFAGSGDRGAAPGQSVLWWAGRLWPGQPVAAGSVLSFSKAARS